MDARAVLSKPKHAVIEDQDVFDDSSFLANFAESSFQEAATRPGNQTLDRSDLNVRSVTSLVVQEAIFLMQLLH